MKVKKARKLRDVLMITGILIMLCASIYAPLSMIGAVIAFSGLVPHFMFNKCPRCGRQLGRNDGEYCQYCGAELE